MGACALVSVVIAGILLDAFFVSGWWARMVVSGVSMGEDLDGDRVLVDRSAFAWRRPRRWETVVLRAPENPDMLCVKRIVGLPGEVVAIAGGDVYIDGAPAENSPNRPDASYTPGPEPQYRLQNDEYFLLGDNSPRSLDSRAWSRRGGVHSGLLLGPALTW